MSNNIRYNNKINDYCIIPWSIVSSELFGRRPCTNIPAPPPLPLLYSYMTGCFSLSQVYAQVIHTHVPFYGECVGSAGPDHNHVC